jgi:serine/threonine protein kinase HipA of HipAB toxin-antitoxin module
VPTTRPRHTITETPSVQAALDDLRAKLGEGERIDFAELVTLGAEAKARQLTADDEATTKARTELAEAIRAGSLRYNIDVDAADEVKHVGLITIDPK